MKKIVTAALLVLFVSSLAPAQNREDACHVYVVDVALARKAFEGFRQTGNSEADAKVLSVGQTVFPVVKKGPKPNSAWPKQECQ